MGADGDDLSAVSADAFADSINGFARDAKLGRCATPEQIAGGSSDNSEIGLKIFNCGRDRRRIDSAELTIDDQGIVAGALQQSLRVTEFERKMRLTASEIDTAFEAPRRVDENETQGERP